MYEIIKRILRVFDEHHLWDAGVELIGSWCFNLYQRHLGARAFPLRTLDVDFLIPTPYKGKESFDLVSELEKLGFEYSFRRDGSIYLWNVDLKIEFISPEKGRGTTTVYFLSHQMASAWTHLLVDELVLRRGRIKGRAT